MDESIARALAHRVVAEFPPLDPVDLDHVVRVAKQRRQRRNRLLTAAAAGLILVVTLAVAALVAGVGTDDAAPITVRPTRSATPSASSSADQNVFEPVTDRLTVGWLPDGLPHRVSESAIDELVVMAQPTGTPTSYARVRVAPAGKKVPFDRGVGGATVLTVPGRPDAGTKLYRFRDGSYQLRWEWAPGAPAILELSDGMGLSDTEAAQTALRIQAESRVVHNSSVRSPVVLAWPESVKLRVVTEARPHNTDVTVIMMDFGADPNLPWARIILYPNPVDLAEQVSWNTTLNGHRAQIEGNGGTVLVDLSPTVVSVQCLQPPLTADRIEHCKAMAASARLVGDPTKPSTWPVLSVP